MGQVVSAVGEGREQSESLWGWLSPGNLDGIMGASRVHGGDGGALFLLPPGTRGYFLKH